MNAPIACAFGFVENVDGCPEPAGYRITVKAYADVYEAFACRGHLSAGKRAAAANRRTYTVEALNQTRRPA